MALRILRSHSFAKLAIETPLTQGVLPLDSIKSRGVRGSSEKTISLAMALKVRKGKEDTAFKTQTRESLDSDPRITRSMTRQMQSLALVQDQGTRQ
jgi:hypothetical protein